MTKHKKEPRSDEASAFDTLQHRIDATERQAPEDRVPVLERFCAELLQFGIKAQLPPRVLNALREAARGGPLPETLLPIVAADFPEPRSTEAARDPVETLKRSTARAARPASGQRRTNVGAALARWRKGH